MIFKPIPRDDFVLDLKYSNIKLIEGYEGSGKTTFS